MNASVSRRHNSVGLCAVRGEDDRPASILRSYRFSVTPTTCLHNVASGPDESGGVIEYVNCKIVAPTGNSVCVNDFARAGYKVDRADAVVIRESGENEADTIFLEVRPRCN
jgi:hypothetical protein